MTTVSFFGDGLKLTLGVGASIAVGVFLALCFAVKNIDSILKTKAAIQSLFIKFSPSARKGAISNRIRGEVLAASKKCGADSIFPKDVKIEWVKEDSEVAFLDNKQVIIRMSNHNNPKMNMVKVACALVAHGAAVDAKRYFTAEMTTATDHILTRKLLSLTDRAALDVYDKQVYTAKMIDENIVLKEYVEKFAAADRSGIFTLIFLNEVTKYAKNLYPEPFDASIENQIKHFLEHITSVADGMNNYRYIDKDYRKFPFYVTIILSANQMTLEQYGDEFYITKIQKTMTVGHCRTEYIFALGKKISIAKRLAHQAHATMKNLHIFEHSYTQRNLLGEQTEAICIEITKDEIVDS